jgi:hypothetical protein
MAEKKFFVDINLQGSALTNAKIGTNTGIGSTEGAFGYDSAAHRLQYFDGTATKEVANLSDISAVTGGLIFQGGYDPTTNTPDITDGSALKGFFWAVTAAGTFLGESVQVGDSIVAKVDNAGTTLSDWLILQGNIVVATDSVDGISRLATQAEANEGTEGGAVVITPATLQGKIDDHVVPLINDKLSKSGGTMSGSIDMGNNNITNITNLFTEDGGSLNSPYLNTDHIGQYYGPDVKLSSDINALNTQKIINLPAPTNDGDATNKTYVDDAASTAQANAEATASADATTKADAAQAAAEAYADSLAPNYDAAGSAAQALTDANAYTDTGLAAKLDLAGGTMSGAIDLNGNKLHNVDTIYTENLDAKAGFSEIKVLKTLNADSHSITNLPAPTNDGDAANKEYVDTTAATAESNANDYTDAQFYEATFSTADWELIPGFGYKLTVLHNIGTNAPKVTTIVQSLGSVEFFWAVNDTNEIAIISNFIPTSETVVGVSR